MTQKDREHFASAYLVKWHQRSPTAQERAQMLREHEASNQVAKEYGLTPYPPPSKAESDRVVVRHMMMVAGHLRGGGRIEWTGRSEALVYCNVSKLDLEYALNDWSRQMFNGEILFDVRHLGDRGYGDDEDRRGGGGRPPRPAPTGPRGIRKTVVAFGSRYVPPEERLPQRARKTPQAGVPKGARISRTYLVRWWTGADDSDIISILTKLGRPMTIQSTPLIQLRKVVSNVMPENFRRPLRQFMDSADLTVKEVEGNFSQRAVAGILMRRRRDH